MPSIAWVTYSPPAAPAWDPSQAFPSGATKVSWWRANDIAQSDGSNVTAWNDNYGNNNLTGQSTFPILKLNIANGKSVVRFAATTGFKSGNVTWGTGKVSWWACMMVNNTNSFEFLELSTNPSTTNMTFSAFIDSSANNRLLHTFRRNSGGTFASYDSTNGIGNTAFRILFGVIDTSLSSHIANGYINTDNSGSYANDTQDTSNFTAGVPLFVGARNMTTDPMSGDLAEIGCVSTAFSATDRSNLATYLANYYGAS